MALNATEIGGLYPAFTDGEMSVGPVSQLTAPGMSSFYFSRIFDDLPPGRYKIRTTINDAGSLWVGSRANSMRMITTFTIDQDLTAWEHEFDLYEGDRRFDIYVHNLSTMAGPAGFVFGLYRNGKLVYRSRAEHWRYETTGPVADVDLSGAMDTRRAMQVFTVLPNWADGLLERIEYLTDILGGERASEQRRALRTNHRRSIEASFLRKGVTRARLANFFAGVGSKPFLMPLWHEQHRLQYPLGPASPLLVFPEDTLAQREFRAGDTAIVFDKDPNVFDVVVLQGIDLANDTVSIGAGLTRTWDDGARIIPLRKARLMDAPSMDNRTDSIATMQLRFELLDGATPFDESWGHCAPLFTLEPNWRDSVVSGYERLTFQLDNSIAAPSVVDPSDQTQVTMRAGFVLRGRERVTYLRKFIAAARGRARRFYMPTHTNDVHPLGDISAGQTYFDIEPAALWESTQTRQFSRRVLGFFFVDGSAPLYRTVLSVEPVGLSGPPYAMSAERLLLDQAMPAVLMRNVARISWMQAVRFDQDAFEINHMVDSSAVVRTTLVFKGVDPAGMPNVDCT